MIRAMGAGCGLMLMAAPAGAVALVHRVQSQSLAWSHDFSIDGTQQLAAGPAPLLRFRRFQPVGPSAVLTGVRIIISDKRVEFATRVRNGGNSARAVAVRLLGASVLTNDGLRFSDSTVFLLATAPQMVPGRLGGLDGQAVAAGTVTAPDSQFDAVSLAPFQGDGTFGLVHSLTGLLRSRAGGDAGVQGDSEGRVSGITTVEYRFEQTVVPEPARWMMLLSGFGLVGTVMRRRRVVALA